MLSSVVAVVVLAAVSAATAEQARLSRISVDPATGHFVDELGRVRFFRGINSLLKRAPWYQEGMQNSSRHAQLADLGFNVVRLGAMWTGVEPDKEDVINNTYVSILENIVDSLASHGVYTLLDLHQDVLWKIGFNDSDPSGYWGVPPWLKHKLPPSEHPYPWPMVSIEPSVWICGYFSQEISKGFQDIYNDVMGASQSFAAYWKFLAGTFSRQTGILGYELMNEPWAGDIFSDASLLLPGVAGRRNLEPLYRLASKAIRQADDDAIVFWEPVTWAYALPIKAHPTMDRLIEGIMSRHTIMDFLAVLKPLCGPMQASANLSESASLKAFKSLVSEIGAVFQGGDDDSSKSNNNIATSQPSVWGPGLSEVPGGSDYLNRTAMSWHYYCWVIAPSEGPYDPAKKFFCDSVHGPRTFSTVKQRVVELGNSGRMLTEFGLCYPNMSKPDSQNTQECLFVVDAADKHLESWIYWDTADGNIIWDEKGNILPDVAAVFSRPYPMAVAGTPVAISFNVKSKEFRFDFVPDENKKNLATEIFVPELHYPDEAYSVSLSSDLRWEKGSDRSNTIWVFLQGSVEANSKSSFVQISPKKQERLWLFNLWPSIFTSE